MIGEVHVSNMLHRTQRLIDDLRPIRRPASTDSGDTSALREKLLIWFQQWVGLFQRSPAPEKAFVPFVTQLTRQGILKMDETSSVLGGKACKRQRNHDKEFVDRRTHAVIDEPWLGSRSTRRVWDPLRIAMIA